MPVTDPLLCRPFLPGRFLLCLTTATVLAATVLPPRAKAADNSWTNGAGTFVWNTTDANWAAPTVWNNDGANADGAVFGPTGAGTISLTGTINARSLNFSVDGYTLTGGTLNILNSGSGILGAGTINVGGSTSAPSDTTATINSNLFSPTGLIKTGDGTLVLGGSGNSFTGLVATTGGTGSGYGANLLIGSATATQYGGSLRLASASALPDATTVAIGRGVLDIGANNVTLGGLIFTGTNPSVAYVPNRQGVIGTGTLTLTGPIRVIYNGLGWGNYINVPISANGGTLRLEPGGGQFGRELTFLQPISNGSLFKTIGVGGDGEPQAGGMYVLGNNTYTGSTTINGGFNSVGGTNASTDLRVVNAFLRLCGPMGSYGAATSIQVVGGNLVLDNSIILGGPTGPDPPLPNGNLDNRLGTSATVMLARSSLELQAGNSGPINQTIASLSIPAGSSSIQLRLLNGHSANLFVTGDTTIGPLASLTIHGNGLQTTAATVPGSMRVVVNGNLPPEVNGIIPGLYGINAFMRNSSVPGVGLVTLAPGDYSNDIFGPTLNVNLTAALTLTSSQSANALRASFDVTINSGATLTVGAGGIVIGQSISFSGPGTLSFGNTLGRIQTIIPATFDVPITGTAGLVVGGSATLNGDLSGLSGGITTNGLTTLNTTTFTGPIHVSDTLVVTADIGAGGPITLGTTESPSGTVGPSALLDINNAAVTNFARDIVTIGSDGTAPFAGLGGWGLRLRTLTTAPQTVSGNISLGTHLTVNASGTSVTTLSGQIGGPGGLHVLSGVVALNNSSNTFQGGLQLTGGVTTAASDAALGSGGIRFQGGTMRTDYSGTFNRGLTVLTTGTFDTNGNSVSVAGSVGGENPAAVLTKAGAGTLTLNGANPFPGSTVVNGGTLVVAGGGSFGAFGSSITVNSGGTLAGVGIVNGAVTVNDGGTVRGGPGGSANLTVMGNATLNAATDGGGRLAVEVAGPAPILISRLSVNGVLNLAGLAVGTPTPSDPKFVLALTINPAETLLVGETYSFLIAETTGLGNIRRNGSPLTAGTVIHQNDYILTSSEIGAFDNVQLAVNESGTGLVLTFTPVPEPTTVLGLCTAALGLAFLARRKSLLQLL